MTIKSQRTKLLCGLLIFAWIAESAAQGGKIEFIYEFLFIIFNSQRNEIKEL
jgi:hypothetical protein